MARKRKAKAAAGKRLHAEMRQLGKRLDALAAAARKAEAGIEARTRQQLRALQRKQATAKRSLAKLARRGAAASGPIKTGLRKAWRDIELATRQATRRFRQTG